MSLVESTAAFRQGCDEITTDGSLRVALDGQAIRTHSAMAFMMGTPQMTPTEDQFGALAQRVFGGAPNVGQMSAIRRIHFESTTLVISTKREKVTSEGAEKGHATKKILPAEKKQRKEDQLARLNGISKVIEAEWNSELKYQWCMMRRGLAFNQYRVLSWNVHQHWVNYMLNLWSRPVNPGFQQIKLDQLVRADREPWTLLTQEVSGSLKMGGSEIPLDKHVTTLATDPRATRPLLPLPANQRVNYSMRDGCQLSTSGTPAKSSRGLRLCAYCHKAGHSMVVCREAKKG